MNYEVENLGNSMNKLTITVDAETFEKAMAKSYNKNKGRIRIQGFRPGKAPRKIIEKTYGPEIFYEDAANYVIPDAYEKAEKESGLEIVSSPSFDVEKIQSGQEFVFTAVFAVKPEVALGEYKGLQVEKHTVEVTDDEVNEEIDRVRDQNCRMVTIEDRPVQDGDTVTINYEGFIDGKPFEGGKGDNYPLVIGSHTFIDNFEEQLIGTNPGDELDVNVTFPENYHEETLKGKPALFKVSVGDIRMKELPALDDEFAGEVSEYETLDEYRESVRNSIFEKKDTAAKREKENEALRQAVENAQIEIPEPMIDEQVKHMMQDFNYQIASQGLSLEQYMQMTGMTQQTLESQMRPEAETRTRTRLTLEAVAAAENLEAAEEDIEKEIEKMAELYKMTSDKFKEMMGETEKKEVAKQVAVKKAIALIADAAVEVEKETEE